MQIMLIDGHFCRELRDGPRAGPDDAVAFTGVDEVGSTISYILHAQFDKNSVFEEQLDHSVESERIALYCLSLLSACLQARFPWLLCVGLCGRSTTLHYYTKVVV